MDNISSVTDNNIIFGIGGGVALVSLAAALIATDPQKRREQEMEMSGGNEMDAVKTYFNEDGFERWKKIYGTTDDVNKVQLDIREGHEQTIEKIIKWLKEENEIKNNKFCDCGCGTGSLAIPLAIEGGEVTASDISSAMVNEAKERYEDIIKKTNIKVKEPVFKTSDLESMSGSFDTVTCVDVLIHYPQDKVDDMISHLANISKRKIILSFAPRTPYYSFLRRVGELFPGPSKTTRAYLHYENDIEKSLNNAGFYVKRKEMTATQFYYSKLFEAVKK